MAYAPRSHILVRFLAMVEADPLQEFSSREIGDLLCCVQRAVPATLAYAMKAGKLYRRRQGTGMIYRGTPYGVDEFRAPPPQPSKPRNPLKLKAKPAAQWTPDPGDPRISKVVPGWTPPVMRHVRGGQ
jgi:hypothetical protein